MRVVFFGTPELAVPSLAALAKEYDIVALVCQPDRAKGRSRKPIPPQTKMWAETNGIPVHQPTKLNDGTFEQWLRDQRPGVCALAAYGRILKQPILDVPTHGFLNMHPSLLPKYRGPSPIQSALINGDTETGVTIIRLTLEMDAGDVLLQERTPIDPDEDGVTLSERLAETGAELLSKAVKEVEQGSATFTPQNDDDATYCKMLTKDDGRIDWNQSASSIHNLVRGTQPWPGAFTKLGDDVIKIFKTSPIDQDTSQPAGTVVRAERGNLEVATGNGTIAILNLQAPGKKAMPAEAFLLGRPLKPGDRFGD